MSETDPIQSHPFRRKRPETKMDLDQLLRNIPIQAIIDSRAWAGFVAGDDLYSIIGARVIPLSFVTYILRSHPGCSLEQITLLEHEYTSTRRLSEIYQLMQLEQLVPTNDFGKPKVVRSFFGMLYSYDPKLCDYLTENIFGVSGIQAHAQHQCPKSHVLQLFDRMKLPKLQEVVNGQLYQLKVKKSTRRFFKKRQIEVPVVLAQTEIGQSTRLASFEAYRLAKLKLDELGITLEWFEQSQFETLLKTKFNANEVTLIRLLMSSESIRYLTFRCRNGRCEMYTVKDSGKALIYAHAQVSLSDIRETCLRMYLIQRMLQ